MHDKNERKCDNGSFAIIETMNELATFSGPSADGVGGAGDATFRLVLSKLGASKKEKNAQNLQNIRVFRQSRLVCRLSSIELSRGLRCHQRYRLVAI